MYFKKYFFLHVEIIYVYIPTLATHNIVRYIVDMLDQLGV